jgi:secondary thiamine-phosphate synthase enzyme
VRESLRLSTTRRDEVVDLTEQVAEVVAASVIGLGECLIYCPHTTAGIVINEGYDPDVTRDVLGLLNRLIPWHDADYRHAEGNTAAHLKAMLCGTSQRVLVEHGRLRLGRWQAIQFYEFDGPREREVVVSVTETPR